MCMHKKYILIALLSLPFYIVAQSPTIEKSLPLNVQSLSRAEHIAYNNIIVDGHVDLPYRLKVKNFRLERTFAGIPVTSTEGDFDFVRARRGGLDAPFMSIFIPASYQEGDKAKLLADSLINMVNYVVQENPQFFILAKTPTDVVEAYNSGRIALPLGMENGAPLLTLDDISYYKEKGISYVTLTHGKFNHICDSSYDTIRPWNGLSPYGYDVISTMQKVGIMIDISHVSDSTFYDVISFVDVPIIASHSSCRRFTPGFERNIDDQMLDRIRLNGGIVMVNFGSTFLDSKISNHNDSLRQIWQQYLEENSIDPQSMQADSLKAVFKATHPILYADVKTVADHIDHIRAIAGIDHIGLGSDYDGVGDSLPTGLKDVSSYPNLIQELLDRQYSEEDIAKICYKNLFRVWQHVLDYSSQ